jgi:hypothetical protein
MQAPARLPVTVRDIDLAARLRSNGRSRTRRIPGMAARQIRQRCSRDSNSDTSKLRLSWRLRAYHDDGPPQRRARRLERRINRIVRMSFVSRRIPYTCTAPEPVPELLRPRFSAPHFRHLLSIRVLPCLTVRFLRSNASFTKHSASSRIACFDISHFLAF